MEQVVEKMRGRRRRNEIGAVLAEAALITPIFLLLLFGILEWGYAFLDRSTVKNTSLVAARVASSEGSNPSADYNVLQAAKKAAAGMRRGDIDMIVVYKATNANATVPTPCLTSSSAGSSCNRYLPADLDRPQSDFGVCGATAPDQYWCPTTRKTAVNGSNGPPDYIGVYVQATHKNITGLFGSTYVFKTDTIIRIEPTRAS